MNFELFGPSITDLEINTVMDAMKNGWYGEKKYWYVENFEKEFAKYHGRAYAIMTPNCTTAIHLLLLGLGIGPGDEVIVPECTWIASATHITHVGAKTVFADIDEKTWCMSAESLEKTITPKTKAVIVVDLYGNMPDMDAIREITKKHGIYLIEDSAGALGSVYKGQKAGSFGVGSVFSFHRTKTITTGEGGMLLLDDKKIFERCHFLRDHGRSKEVHYFNTEVAFKYMPTNLLASLGFAQFQRVEELVLAKRKLLLFYREIFSDIPDLYLNPEPPEGRNGAWCTSLIFGHSHNVTKESVMKALNEKGLEGRPFFYPLSCMPAYGGASPEKEAKNPIAYDLSKRGICLPAAFQTDAQNLLEYCNAIRSIIGFQERKVTF
ncbi:DegT/DnrJ/EryC1/StrS family aminotransferase [Leptospira ognonensis]|uniref:DegT/DnrJ/EryC1/StrS family aminotransferase n=1 Tax=Leptospira ognonensis TaxID=2484945 RepID=A0A4R9K5W1_9LEPT|nr:DegT/DnrJ/EryC1/StrS family aminotransferase [Leptospira ognonensis]TGL59758.1 DegT/DnrJ/EryC1/StrS family aminotransferase [Leptospira ognonensis]